MKRHTVLDTSIAEDQLEHDRIQLEHNLQHTDLSLHLSSNDDDTVEYPRHNSAPAAPFADFISFDGRSRDHFDDEIHSPVHAWSYRTADDDDDGVSPYGGSTVSTAAHHASALTLSAGLHGRGGKREISLSGAEYDPDRPLHHMLAAVDPKLSMFDMEPSRSRYEPPFHSPGPLDRVLQSGHAPSNRSRSVRIRSPHSSATSSASSDSESQRPRLSDALQRVTLSPKRPRSPQAVHHPNHRHAQVPPSPLRAMDDSNLPTPRPPRRTAPVVSPTASQFTKAARGITRELAEGQHDRNPFHDLANRDATGRSTHNKSRVYLPDVTGLTSAVESPAKPGGGYNAYTADDRPRDSEARLLTILATVQAKLHDLEDENAISRRRVRELELELEVCKREVAKERTRVLERSEMSLRLQESEALRAKGKGKARAVDPEPDADVEARYREAVEEKKALESLISTLRSHLTRLTAELSSHQELLMELRKLRERDSRALKEKSAEVDRLRQEVERLAGEVEVLRGVVEEGLRERRTVRDTSSVIQSAGDLAMSRDLEEESRSEEYAPEEEEEEEEEEDRDPLDDRSSMEKEEEDESEAEPFDPISIMGSSRENGALPDRTTRTDHATRGSSFVQHTSRRFIGGEELARIAADVEERRSELSSGSIRERERDRAASPSPPPQQNRRATVEEVSDAGTEIPRAPSPAVSTRTAPSGSRHPPRPTVPTPSRARQSNHDHDPETAFPQIRGARLERLFFSAPEHNARTCTVCCRERGPEPPRARSSWLAARTQRPRLRELEHEHEDEDEGFVEGEDDVDIRYRKREGKQRERDREPGDVDYEAAARKAGVPPQTVVTHVIRELEDDFVHYKSIYVELADQYKEMDAVSDVPKRNLVAKHLREVVEILEQKGDQIASLYSCLTFKDKSIPGLKRPGAK